MHTQPLRPNVVLILTCLLAFVLFLLGIVVPSAHLWGSFLLPVVLVYLWGSQSSWRRDIYAVTALASVLVFAEHWSQGATTFADLLLNHLAPILVLWAVALLLAQRRQQQEQLAQRKEELDAHARQLAAIVEASHEAIISAGTDGTILSINHSAEELYGVSTAEAVGRSVADVALPQNIAAFGELLGRVGAGETVTADSWSWQLPDGTARFISASVSPMRDGEGRVTAFAALAHDITARRQAEALVYAQRDLARTIGTFDTVESGFHAILDIMLRLTGMDSGGFYLFSSDGQRLELVYHHGLGAAFVGAVGSYPLTSINAQMILAGTAYYLAYDQPAAQNPVFTAENLHSLAAIPIQYQERVIGCIYLSSHTEDEVRQFARAALEPLAVEVGNFVVHLQSQAALRAGEEKFRQLADTINEVFWIFDNREQRLIYLNPAYEKVWGISIEDTYADSRKYSETVHPDDRPILFAALERQAQGEQTEMEYRIVRPDGTVRWIFDRSFPILGEDGQVQRTTGVATDITALKHNQHELQQLNHALEERVRQRTAEVQDLYDNAPTGYHSLDTNGCFLRINQTHADWLGFTRAELIGRSVTEFLTEEGRATFAAVFDLFRRQGWVRDLEFDLVRKDGSTFPVLINATAVYDGHGSFVASRSTVFDNTERKRAEQALRASEETLRLANAELVRAMRMKDEFLATMSHELRTPLHGILAVTETLHDQVLGPLNPRQQKSVGLVEQSGRHLLALINELLDLSKIEAGRLELHCAPVAVDDVCRASLLFVRGVAAKKEIEVDYANATPGVQIAADEQRLKQMLVNLLSNAVKFTPNGGHVRLSVAVEPGDQGDPAAGLIRFTVQDDGPGIAPAAQARLFLPFIQLDAQLSRQYEGTGLGLALVKRLAEHHGGSVRLDSTGIPGEGCRFTITLPLAPAPSPA